MDEDVIDKNFRLLAMALFSGLTCIEDEEAQSTAMMAEQMVSDLGIDEFTIERAKKESVRMFKEWEEIDTSYF